MKLPQIYCDMDGVLADLEKFCMDHLNEPINRTNWINLPEDVFFQLPLMKDAKILWSYIVKFDPFILTALPKHDEERSKRAKKDKILWMKEKFNFPEEKMYCVFRHEKQNFSLSKKNGMANLLIDDYIVNIEEFKKKGGIAIHHKNSLETIQHLKKIGFP
ncbi:MAG: hypothetical protein CME68_06300 [Halobacteriovoraceae bacterium]|nr:hypothetical protein [Halobacteriovoraceae bacterium]